MSAAANATPPRRRIAADARGIVCPYRRFARERDVIAKHMFPLTLRPPRFRESWIVCLADKWCPLEETLAVRLGLTLKE